MCVIPFRHNFTIHRALNYGVIVCEHLPIFLCFVGELVLQRLNGGLNHSPQLLDDFIVLRLALRLCLLDELAPLVHFVLDVLNEHSPLGLNSLFNLHLELIALGIVLRYVLQPPAMSRRDLFLQGVVCEDVRTSNLP